ncbi:MAG: CPBP family intramembrane metalloprotease [Chitinophagales bacterium]|nr:CPBP family intramembrane metalloprotease [Chitinophagales bacterium]
MLLAGGINIPIIKELIFKYPLRYKIIHSKIIKRTTWDLRTLVYLSIIIFGILHSTNYENDTLTFFLLIPLITLSQIIMGILLTFLRLKFNIFSSMILHMLWNSSVFIIIIVTQTFKQPYLNKTHNIVYFDRFFWLYTEFIPVIYIFYLINRFLKYYSLLSYFYFLNSFIRNLIIDF